MAKRVQKLPVITTTPLGLSGVGFTAIRIYTIANILRWISYAAFYAAFYAE